MKTEKIFTNPIVTEVKEATPFYTAEEHLDYYNQNTDQPYCTYIIDPKIKKLKTLKNLNFPGTKVM